MNATQAREKAATLNAQKSSSQYSQIMLRIKKAVNSGHFNLIVDETISTEVRTELIKQGYEIGRTSFFRNEVSTLIKW
jgi:hypothetical protein